MYLGIDPGKNGLALTVLNSEGLYFQSSLFQLPKKPLANVQAWLPQVRAWLGPRSYSVAVEQMLYRPQRASAKGSSEIAAILELQAIGGLVAGVAGGVIRYGAPEVCKGGSIPKHIAHARLLEGLTPEEIDELTRDCSTLPGRKPPLERALAHNLLDSCLIAKWGCK